LSARAGGKSVATARVEFGEAKAIVA